MTKTFASTQLAPDEQLIYVGRLGRSFFVKPILLSLIIIGLPLLLVALITAKTTELAVTNKRLIVKKGLINIKTEDFFFKNIESAQVQQTFFQRMLNSGEVMITGTGRGVVNFEHVGAPFVLKNHISQAIER